MRAFSIYLLTLALLAAGCAAMPLRVSVTVTLADGPQTEIEYAIASTEETLTRLLAHAVRAKYEDRLIKLQTAKKAGRRWVTKEDM